MRGDFTRLIFKPEKHYDAVLIQQGRVLDDASVNEHSAIAAHLRETEVQDILGPCGAPQDNAGFAIGVTGDGTDLTISAGRLYVDGILCELEAPLTYSTQPDYPNPTPALGAEDLETGKYVAYLDVWKRHITALEDPSIREVALGGPDTTTRSKAICQVKLRRAGDLTDDSINCLSEHVQWDTLTAPSSGQMRARAEPQEEQSTPCIVPASAGFRGLENQLYRVEVQQVISPTQITIKWSRENGSIVTAWEGQDPLDPNKLTVSSTGRDETLGLAADNWAELTDDGRELRGEPGLLVKVLSVAGNVLTIDPGAATVDRNAFPLHPKVRRWDMPGDTGEITVDLTLADNWIALENGVEISFASGTYSSGDYWLIPARTATRDIEWPRDATSGDPLPQLPHGIAHHYCRLALLSFDGQAWVLLDDCRTLFPPLTQLEQFLYIGGDGQEAMPGQELCASLEVGLCNGQDPVAGRAVLFQVAPDHGTLIDPGNAANTGASMQVMTDANGIAACRWQLGANVANVCQRATAMLLDAAAQAVLHPIHFNASLSLASRVAYDPSNCPDLAQAGVDTVQEALDQLCQLIPRPEPGIGIQQVLTLADNLPLLNDVLVPVTRFARGVRIVCDAVLSQESGGSVPPEPPSRFPGTTPAKPTCIVTLDMPYPYRSDDRNFWGIAIGEVVGFQPLILAGTVAIRGSTMEWTPTRTSSAWLQGPLFARLTNPDISVTDRLLVHLTIKGNFIWRGDAEREPTVYLDGDVFGRPGANGRIDLRLPSGDGRRGGDFDMWFWLMPPTTAPTLTIDATVTTATTGAGIIRSIAGTVRASAATPASGATVTLAGPGSTRTALTNTQGQFGFANVTPGTYTVTAQFRDLSGQVQVVVPGTATPSPFDPRNFPGRTLAEVPGLGPAFIARLAESGITHPAEVAGLDAPTLAERLRVSESRARAILDAAQRLLSSRPHFRE